MPTHLTAILDLLRQQNRKEDTDHKILAHEFILGS